MRIDLNGRTALVTGSTQGIGLAIAAGLADAGASVAVNGRRPERVAEAIGTLRSQNPDRTLLPAPGDVTTEEGADAVLAAIPAEMIHYGTSKTALLAVSRGFAKEAAGTGVTVNSVIAGPTHTGGVEDFVYELVDRDLPWDEAQREFMVRHRPMSLLQRLIEPEEIANMVTYLSSPLASATTGAAVRVDGGYVDSIVP